jgi:hypothetical protein
MSRSFKARLVNAADFLAIAAGVYVIGTAIGRGPLLSPEAMEAIGNKDAVWLIHIVSGGLALFAIFVADRNVLAGRVMLAVSGLLFLSALLFFREFGALAIFGVLVPAVTLLATSALIQRPIITPEERAAWRRQQGYR